MSLSDEALDQAVAPRVLKLVGRLAIVTGSDSGMGRAIAEAFAMEGADVAVTFHSDRDGAEETARQVADAGRRAIVQKLDVADEGSVVSLFQTVNDRLGPPSILVNSAGSMGASGTQVVDLSGRDFDRVLKTDFYGPFYCCREFVRRRRAVGGGGRIVNITSVHEAIPSPTPPMARPRADSSPSPGVSRWRSPRCASTSTRSRRGSSAHQ